MKHILDPMFAAPVIAICGSVQPGDEFVVAAMQSDCDACRTHPRVNCGRVGDVRWDGRGSLGVRAAVPEYAPEPWGHIVTLEEQRSSQQRAVTAAQHNREAGSTIDSFTFTPRDGVGKRRRKR